MSCEVFLGEAEVPGLDLTSPRSKDEQPDSIFMGWTSLMQAAGKWTQVIWKSGQRRRTAQIWPQGRRGSEAPAEPQGPRALECARLTSAITPSSLENSAHHPPFRPNISGRHFKDELCLLGRLAHPTGEQGLPGGATNSGLIACLPPPARPTLLHGFLPHLSCGHSFLFVCFLCCLPI